MTERELTPRELELVQAFAISSSRRMVELLTELRNDCGLTQDDVAQVMGTGQSSVAKMENFTHDPGLSKVMRYVAALGLDPSILVEALQVVADMAEEPISELDAASTGGSDRKRESTIDFSELGVLSVAGRAQGPTPPATVPESPSRSTRLIPDNLDPGAAINYSVEIPDSASNSEPHLELLWGLFEKVERTRPRNRVSST